MSENVMSPMRLIGVAKGTRWYFADDHFDKPGIYFFDGKVNINVIDRIEELNQEQAAIKQGIRKEFTHGEMSDDVVQDFGTFLDHHQQVEKELKEWKEILARRDNHIVDNNNEIVALKTERDALKKALKPFASGVDFVNWGKIKAHLPVDLARQLTRHNYEVDKLLTPPNPATKLSREI